MLKGIESKNMMFIYAVIGFGSVALVALGELSGVEAGSPLYNFYLKLVFGGFLIFYSVLIHLALLTYSRKLDESRITVFSFAILVLLYWIYAFAELMGSSDFKFF
jgi:hypothetical protein